MNSVPGVIQFESNTCDRERGGGVRDKQRLACGGWYTHIVIEDNFTSTSRSIFSLGHIFRSTETAGTLLVPAEVERRDAGTAARPRHIHRMRHSNT